MKPFNSGAQLASPTTSSFRLCHRTCDRAASRYTANYDAILSLHQSTIIFMIADFGDCSYQLLVPYHPRVSYSKHGEPVNKGSIEVMSGASSRFAIG